MRIIAGSLKGRKFTPPKGLPTRPTTDFAKEGLFNILESNWDLSEVKYLDLFGGSGNLSYEMYSRACRNITIVDNFDGCIRFIENTAEKFGIDCIKPVKADVFRFINSCKEQFDLIFAGPPYPLSNLAEIPDKILSNNLLKKEGWFILEHSPEHNFENHPNFFHHRNYSKTNFSIFRMEQKEAT
ncbi:MAG: RsmD family RNA methyltransferase [Chitinophagales bacterium]